MFRWFSAGVLTVAVLTVVILMTTNQSIQSELKAQIDAVLDDPKFSELTATIDGRAAAVSGQVASEEIRNLATLDLRSIEGIRDLSLDISVPPQASPYILSIEKVGEGLTVSGAVPWIDQRDSLIARLEETGLAVTNQLTIAQGAPETFTQQLDYAIGAVKLLKEGKVELSDATTALSGDAATSDDFAALETLGEEAVATGLAAPAIDATPPVVTPYTFAITRQGDDVTLNGVVPSISLKEQLLAQAETLGLAITDNLSYGAGAPSGFSDAAAFMMGAMSKFTEGSLSLSDGSLAVDGQLADQSAYFEFAGDELAAAIPGFEIEKGDLSPPVATDFNFSITIDEGGIAMTGDLSEIAVGEGLIEQAAEADRPVTQQFGYFAGAPDGYDDVLGAALALALQLDRGQIDVANQTIKIDGTYTGEATMAELNDGIKSGLPGGFAVESLNLVRPVTDQPNLFAELAAENAEALQAAEAARAADLARQTQLVAAAAAAEHIARQADRRMVQEIAVARGMGLGLRGAVEAERRAAEDARLAAERHAREAAAAAELQAQRANRLSAAGERSDAIVQQARRTTQQQIAVARGQAFSLIARAAEAKAGPSQAAAEIATTPLETPVADSTIAATGETTVELTPDTDGADTSAGSSQPAAAGADATDTGQAATAAETMVPTAESTSTDSAEPPASTAEAGTDQEPSGSSSDTDSTTADASPAEGTTATGEASATEEENAAAALKAEQQAAAAAAEAAATLKAQQESEAAAAAALKAQQEADAAAARKAQQEAEAAAAALKAQQQADEAAAALKAQQEAEAAAAAALVAQQQAEAAAAELAAAREAEAQQLQSALTKAREAANMERQAQLCHRLLQVAQLQNKIEFPPAKAYLQTGAERILDRFVNLVQQCPTAHVRIEGHTDSSGREDLNMRLSESRANAVMTYFAVQGVENGRLSAQGYGESRPIASNKTDEGRRLNRRIEFIVTAE